jgi:hypothetical protein
MSEVAVRMMGICAICSDCMSETIVCRSGLTVEIVCKVIVVLMGQLFKER